MKSTVGIAISLALIFVLVQGAVFAATVSRTQVYIDNPDDDSLWVKFYLDGMYARGTIAPQNTTRYFDFYRLSEGTHELKIRWKDPDTCEWREKTKTVEATGEDMTVTLGVVPNNTPSCEKTARWWATVAYASLAISVQNNDDDALHVMLFINGNRKKTRTVAKYSTAQFLNIYGMTPGSYNVSIRWKEPDTNEWYERMREVTVAEGKNSITMETEEVVYTYEPMKPTSGVDVYIKNIDDDDLWVDVLVDSGYKLRYVRSDTKRYFGRFDKLYPGKHTVRLRWRDPDVKGWQEKGFIVYLEDGEVLARTFSTDRNVGPIITYQGWMNLV